MPKPQKQLTSRRQPTLEQIAQLSALLHETETLSQQLNFPLSILMNNVLVEGALSLDVVYYFASLAAGPLINSGPLGIGALLAFLPLAYYVYYQLYQVISAQILAVFPNGVGYQRTKLVTPEMQHHLGDSESVDALINTLSTLITAQRVSKNRNLFASFAMTILVPLISSIRYEPLLRLESTRLSLMAGRFGFYFTFSPEDTDTPLGYISNFAGKLQALFFMQSIYRFWKGYNKPKQLTQLAEKLSSLSVLPNFKWRAETKLEMLTLRLNSIKNISFLDKQNKLHNISTENYLNELHRTLLDANLPIYAVGENQLVLGLHQLSNRNCELIKTRLLSRLLNLKQQEEISEDILQKLNNLNKVTISKPTWNYYFEFNNKDNYEVFYFINMRSLNVNLLDIYLDALSKIVPLGCMNIDTDVITLNNIPPNTDFTSIKSKLISIIEQHEEKIAIKQAELDAKENKDEIQSPLKSIITSEENQETQTLSFKEVSISEINFGRGIKFFRPAPETKPANFAFPMHIPWLPKGRAYGSVDPKVFDLVSEYLSTQQVIAPLEKGTITGQSKSHKTKAGAEGIQKTDEPYQNIYGENFRRASFKLKYTNNIRIFGHKDAEVVISETRYIHYRFDGPGFGH